MVAGLTTILFDSFESNCHMVGYVNQITHSLSQGQSLTQVSISHARPLREMLTGLLNQGSRYGMHPAEPLTEIRELFQVEEAANYLFANLLYRNTTDADFTLAASAFPEIKKLEAEILEITQRLQSIEDSLAAAKEGGLDLNPFKEEQESLDTKLRSLQEALDTARSDTQGGSTTASYNYVLNWKELMDVVSSSDSDSSDTITDLNSLVGSGRTTSSQEERRQAYLSLLRGHLRPKERYEQLFYSLPVSMRFVSRPVCTLEEYIDFYKSAPDFINGTSSLTGGRGRGVRGAPVYLDNSSAIAKHYRLIREFVGGPGFEPGSKVAPRDGSTQSEDRDAPELRTELEYRTADDSGAIIKRLFATLKPGYMATVQDLPDLATDAQEIVLLYADLIASRGKL
jgi:hypothetical protein